MEDREPCPWRIVDDGGAAFMFGTFDTQPCFVSLMPGWSALVHIPLLLAQVLSVVASGIFSKGQETHQKA